MGDPDQVQTEVRRRYEQAARRSLTVLDDSSAAPGCCGGLFADPITTGNYDGLDDAPVDALATSLGCGNPTALIDLRPGQRVLDLGCGGGLDVLLSARRVAPDGVAYGLDLTDDMLRLAERNRVAAGVENARFLRGAIEQVPLPDASVDVVISNCVINLALDKDRVLREAFRVLRPGGRFAVSDVVLLRALPEELAGLVGLWTGCVAGALLREDYLSKLSAAGFAQPSVQVTRSYTDDDFIDLARGMAGQNPPHENALVGLRGAVASAFVRAEKPEGRTGLS